MACPAFVRYTLFDDIAVRFSMTTFVSYARRHPRIEVCSDQIFGCVKLLVDITAVYHTEEVALKSLTRHLSNAAQTS